jgi:uncharacterized protein (DUF488 family)
MANPFFTIGHSTRPFAAFADLLTKVEVRLVVDVRTVPRSSTNPQYNRDVLPESLSAYQIAYEHMAVLGGLRGRKRDVLPTVNAFWENQSFHNYADYAMSEDFHSGLSSCANWDMPRSAQSCVRRPCGGDAIGGLSRTT